MKDGRLDLDNPMDLPAESPHSILPVDLNGNGYQDIVIACHRNDVDHLVDSLIYWNGPEGLSPERVTRLPGLGPHGFASRDPGNAYTRIRARVTYRLRSTCRDKGLLEFTGKLKCLRLPN